MRSRPEIVALALALVTIIGFSCFIGFAASRSRDQEAVDRLISETACHGLQQDAVANLERAAEFAERHVDNGFERGQALGRIVALRTVCPHPKDGVSPEAQRRAGRLTDEQLTAFELRTLARDLANGILTEAP